MELLNSETSIVLRVEGTIRYHKRHAINVMPPPGPFRIPSKRSFCLEYHVDCDVRVRIGIIIRDYGLCTHPLVFTLSLRETQESFSRKWFESCVTILDGVLQFCQMRGHKFTIC